MPRSCGLIVPSWKLTNWGITIMKTVSIVLFCLQLPHNLFEELAMDVYDEVDRRENDTSKHLRFRCCLWYCMALEIIFSVYGFIIN